MSEHEIMFERAVARAEAQVAHDLLEAAPFLLSALERMVGEHEELYGAGACECDELVAGACALCDARAAIARANGETCQDDHA